MTNQRRLSRRQRRKLEKKEEEFNATLKKEQKNDKFSMMSAMEDAEARRAEVQMMAYARESSTDREEQVAEWFSKMEAAQGELTGWKISLLLKHGTRYEGTLYTIDPNDSTIALSNVRCVGKEGRHKEKEMAEVDPAPEIGEYVIFKGSDIADLTYLEEGEAEGETRVERAEVAAEAQADSLRATGGAVGGVMDGVILLAPKVPPSEEGG